MLARYRLEQFIRRHLALDLAPQQRFDRRQLIRVILTGKADRHTTGWVEGRQSDQDAAGRW